MKKKGIIYTAKSTFYFEKNEISQIKTGVGNNHTQTLETAKTKKTIISGFEQETQEMEYREISSWTQDPDDQKKQENNILMSETSKINHQVENNLVQTRDTKDVEEDQKTTDNDDVREDYSGDKSDNSSLWYQRLQEAASREDKSDVENVEVNERYDRESDFGKQHLSEYKSRDKKDSSNNESNIAKRLSEEFEYHNKKQNKSNNHEKQSRNQRKSNSEDISKYKWENIKRKREEKLRSANSDSARDKKKRKSNRPKKEKSESDYRPLSNTDIIVRLIVASAVGIIGFFFIFSQLGFL